MYRVVIKRRDHRRRVIIEAGPWLDLKNDAETWASIFQDLGYRTEVEHLKSDLIG